MPLPILGRKLASQYNRGVHLAAALPAGLLIIAASAPAQDLSQLVAQSKRRWAESPHGPMLERILPPTFGLPQLPAPKSRGARLAVQYCVQCHNLPNPAMHHAVKWPMIFERMMLRMRGKGNMGELMYEMMAGVEAPTAAEAELLLAYLQKYSQRPLDPQRYPAIISCISSPMLPLPLMRNIMRSKIIGHFTA